MGFNERYFEQPCVFRPERFGNFRGSVKGDDAVELYKSVPFSAGPRRCIGKLISNRMKTLLLITRISYSIYS